jgi:1,2-diacylglycerol 3-beta-galactosyltransferase
MLKIARRLDAARLPVQTILICGRNQKLRSTLQAMPRRMPMFIEGFTREVPYYMKLSDFFIGKPGPGSISEALAMRLPVITERNAWTMPQERYNAEWLVEKNAGVVVRSLGKEIEAAVRQMLEPERYDRFRSAAQAYENRAVFEIPDILERLLNDVQ